MTADPTPNVGLLDRTLAVIREEAAKPDHGQWKQGEWRCGSGMCFAGWAAQLGGGVWLLEVLKDDDARSIDILLKAEPGEETRFDGTVHIQDRARRILGLTIGEAENLFNGTNDLADIEDAIAGIKVRAADAP